MKVMRTLSIIRTTVAVDDHVLAAARRRARELGLTLGQLVERGLQRELALQESASHGPPIPVFRGRGGARPGVDLTSNRAMLEVMEEGLPLEKLR